MTDEAGVCLRTVLSLSTLSPKIFKTPKLLWEPRSFSGARGRVGERPDFWKDYCGFQNANCQIADGVGRRVRKDLRADRRPEHLPIFFVFFILDWTLAFAYRLCWVASTMAMLCGRQGHIADEVFCH